MTSTNENNMNDEELYDIAGIIKFILILDNSGKRIYCNYYTNNYNIAKSLCFKICILIYIFIIQLELKKDSRSLIRNMIILYVE